MVGLARELGVLAALASVCLAIVGLTLPIANPCLLFGVFHPLILYCRKI